MSEIVELNQTCPQCGGTGDDSVMIYQKSEHGATVRIASTVPNYRYDGLCAVCGGLGVVNSETKDSFDRNKK